MKPNQISKVKILRTVPYINQSSSVLLQIVQKKRNKTNFCHTFPLTQKVKLSLRIIARSIFSIHTYIHSFWSTVEKTVPYLDKAPNFTAPSLPERCDKDKNVQGFLRPPRESCNNQCGLQQSRRNRNLCVRARRGWTRWSYVRWGALKHSRRSQTANNSKTLLHSAVWGRRRNVMFQQPRLAHTNNWRSESPHYWIYIFSSI